MSCLSVCDQDGDIYDWTRKFSTYLLEYIANRFRDKVIVNNNSFEDVC